MPKQKQVTKQVLPLPEYAPQPLTGPLAAAAEFDPPKWAVKNMYRLKGDALCVHASIRSLHAMVDETPDEDTALVVQGWVKPDGSSVPSAKAIVDAICWHIGDAGILVTACAALAAIAKVAPEVRIGPFPLLDARATLSRARPASQVAPGRRSVIDAGGLVAMSRAVDALRDPDLAGQCMPDGEQITDGGAAICKWGFALDCLRAVAGKRIDPRNKKHIQQAIDGGANAMYFEKKLPPELQRDDGKQGIEPPHASNKTRLEKAIEHGASGTRFDDQPLPQP